MTNLESLYFVVVLYPVVFSYVFSGLELSRLGNYLNNRHKRLFIPAVGLGHKFISCSADTTNICTIQLYNDTTGHIAFSLVLNIMSHALSWPNLA